MSTLSVDTRTLRDEGDSVHWLASSLRTEQWEAAIGAWLAWLVAAGVRQRSIDLRSYQLRHFASAHLNRSPWSLRSDDLVRWLSGQAWAPETRKSYRSALRSYYGWAVQTGHTRRNPAAGLRPVRTTTPPPKPTPDHVLADALTSASDRDRLIVMLAAYAGLRRAEIAGLRWADLGAGAIRVQGKGGRVRVIPLHDLLRVELIAEHERRRAGRYGSGFRYAAGQPRVWLFPGRTGAHITADAAGRAATRTLGNGWGAHTLRHRFATRAYAGSHDLLAVQALLGHTNPETTKRYTELADDALAAAVRSV